MAELGAPTPDLAAGGQVQVQIPEQHFDVLYSDLNHVEARYGVVNVTAEMVQQHDVSSQQIGFQPARAREAGAPK